MCEKVRSGAVRGLSRAVLAAADRVMDSLPAACGLCVMYEIHLKFSLVNEPLSAPRLGSWTCYRKVNEGGRVFAAFLLVFCFSVLF